MISAVGIFLKGFEITRNRSKPTLLQILKPGELMLTIKTWIGLISELDSIDYKALQNQLYRARFHLSEFVS